MFNKFLKTRLFIQVTMVSFFATLASIGLVATATTIGTDINTGGTLTVTGTTATSTFSTGGFTVGTSQFVVQSSSGNVGIGTATPNNLLSVYQLIDFNNTDYNTKLGYQAGNNIVSGAQYNTFVGYQAGMASSTASTNVASYNTAIGYQTLYSNTTGYQNSAMGFNALVYNTTGYWNSAMGASALYANTTGYQNSAMGVQALVYNTTGAANSAMGYRTLSSNTTGNSNSAMGNVALRSNTTGNYNSAMGSTALYANTTGYQNSAMGMYALYANTTGNSNSAMGYGALFYNTTGYYNSAMGVAALYSNTTGYNNTANGYNSLYSLKPTSKAITAFADNLDGKTKVTSATHGQTDGTVVQISGTTNYNGSWTIEQKTTSTFVINTAFVANDATGWWGIDTEGRYNTALGYYAGYLVTTGSNNLLLGYQAGDNLTTGSSNIVIGYDIHTPLATSANTLNIGNLIFATGLTATGTVISTGNVGIGTTTPNWLLQVSGTRPSLALSDYSAAANLKHWLFSSMGGNLYIGTSTDAYATSTPAVLTILNNGKISIGTTTAAAYASYRFIVGTGNSYFGGNVTLGEEQFFRTGYNDSLLLGYKPSVSDEVKMLMRNNGGYTPFIFGPVAGYDKNYDHAIQTNPTLFIHSALNPDINNTEWMSLTMTSTSTSGSGLSYGVIDAGTGHDLVLQSTQGNVGIATTTPAATLDINGYMRLKKNTSQPVACGTGNDGAIALNSSYLGCVCNGTSWINIASSTQTCVW